MPSGYQLFSVIGFQCCDLEVGLKLLNGHEDILPSDNDWDWLGSGSYFWEEDPTRAVQYATENAKGKQKNKKAAKTSFVIGAIIEIGNCLNLVKSTSLEILSQSYDRLKIMFDKSGKLMPVNRGNNRKLDCAVINYIHQINIESGKPAYDTVRCAFPEGEEAYPGAMITSRLHVNLRLQPRLYKGVFFAEAFGKVQPAFIAIVSCTKRIAIDMIKKFGSKL